MFIKKDSKNKNCVPLKMHFHPKSQNLACMCLLLYGANVTSKF